MVKIILILHNNIAWIELTYWEILQNIFFLSDKKGEKIDNDPE